jgi:hypothetical protein
VDESVYRSLKEAGVGVILTTLRAALTIEGLGSKPVCRNLNSTIYELNILGFGETEFYFAWFPTIYSLRFATNY